MVFIRGQADPNRSMPKIHSLFLVYEISILQGDMAQWSRFTNVLANVYLHARKLGASVDEWIQRYFYSPKYSTLCSFLQREDFYTCKGYQYCMQNSPATKTSNLKLAIYIFTKVIYISTKILNTPVYHRERGVCATFV